MHKLAAIGLPCQGELLVLNFNVSATRCGVRKIVASLRLNTISPSMAGLFSPMRDPRCQSQISFPLAAMDRWTRGFTGADCSSSKRRQGRAPNPFFSPGQASSVHSRANSGFSGLHLPPPSMGSPQSKKVHDFGPATASDSVSRAVLTMSPCP